jgi:hypothetical protein
MATKRFVFAFELNERLAFVRQAFDITQRIVDMIDIAAAA